MKLPPDLTCTDIATPLGPLRLAASARGLAGVWFEDQRHAPPAVLMARWQSDPAHPVLQQASHALARYFEGEAAPFDLPLDLSHGTPFQQRVWQGLLAIARGRTSSYGELATRIGHAGAVRAVGAAVGRNPLSIVVPCHRVVGSGGALTGYAGGLPRKAALLQLEAGHLPP
mgnify:CR=1 FL=1